MRLPDSFSMRQRPHGLFKVLLGAPRGLYRHGLGWVMGSRFLLITQRLLPADEAAQWFHDDEARHPDTAQRLLDTMGNAYDGTDAGRVAMMAAMPMVAFGQ